MKLRTWVATLALSLAPILTASGQSPTSAPASPWLGVRLAADDGGTRISEVIRGTPAAEAGLRVDDYILHVGNRPVHVPTDVTRHVNRMAVGDELELQLRRKRRVFDARVRLTGSVSPAELLRLRLVGQEAPDFDLPVVHGSDAKRLTMSQFKGKVVVLEFWATWCQNCGEVHERLNQALTEPVGEDESFVVLSMAAESPKQIEDYVQRHHLAYPVAFDRYAKVRDRYHAPSLPTLVVIDQAGVVRFAKAGAGENVQTAISMARRIAVAGTVCAHGASPS